MSEHEGGSPGTEFNPQSGFPAPPPDPYGQSPYGHGQTPYGQAPYGGQVPYPQPGYGYPYAAPAAPSEPQATTALVVGVIGLAGGMTCGLPLLASPFAWAIGSRSRRRIRESNGRLGGEGMATAGFVLGIIGTVLLVLGLIALAIVIIVAANAEPDYSYDGGYYDNAAALLGIAVPLT